ncbi:MAG TPA: NADP-dependent oxidoreductase, partial [Myxococcales bacterium]
MKNRQIVLARRPRGQVEQADFRMVETDLLPVRDGQALTRIHYLSLDPYMRGRMDERKSYAPPQPLGEVMIGATVAEVLESRDPSLEPGDFVAGMAGWQQYQV